MTVKYQVTKHTSGDFSRPMSLNMAMTRLHNRLALQKGPYHVRDSHEPKDWGPWRGLYATLKAVRVRISNANLGTKLLIGPTEGSTWAIRKVEVAPPIIDTVGNDRIDRIYTFVFHKFPKANNLGIYNCRPVANSSTWSQHSWSNALDVGADSMDTLHTIADAVVAAAIGGDLNGIVHTVIVANERWVKGEGWGPYTGIYHYHVHIDADPNYSGTPPCA